MTLRCFALMISFDSKSDELNNIFIYECGFWRLVVCTRFYDFDGQINKNVTTSGMLNV